MCIVFHSGETVSADRVKIFDTCCQRGKRILLCSPRLQNLPLKRNRINIGNCCFSDSTICRKHVPLLTLHVPSATAKDNTTDQKISFRTPPSVESTTKQQEIGSAEQDPSPSLRKESIAEQETSAEETTEENPSTSGPETTEEENPQSSTRNESAVEKEANIDTTKDLSTEHYEIIEQDTMSSVPEKKFVAKMSRSRVHFNEESISDFGHSKVAFAGESVSSLKASIAAFHQSQLTESITVQDLSKNSQPEDSVSSLEAAKLGDSVSSLEAAESEDSVSGLKASISAFKQSQFNESMSSTVAVSTVRNPRASRIGVIPLNINTTMVTFDPQVDTHPSMSKKDMTPEERESYWNSKSEDKKTLMQAKMTIRMIMKGMPFDDIETCSRGLETKTQNESRRRVVIKKKAVAALKAEQELQRLGGYKNPEKLAKAVIEISKELVDAAAEIAAQDERDIQLYMSDTRRYVQRLFDASKRRVDFSQQINMHPALHKKDMTREEREKYWCTKSEDKQCYVEAKKTVIMMMKGMSFDDVETCSRGLESKTRDGLKKRVQNKKKAVNALLMEQKVQRLGGSINPEQLAEVVSKQTKDLAEYAAEVAVQDEQDVQEFLVDTRLYVQSLSVESPAKSE